MPAHNYIPQAGQLANEEHKHEAGEQPRKAVGLFAKDSYGSGTFELSAISTASGPVLSTTPANVSANVALGNVTLNPGPNHIGSVTIFGTVQSTPGMTTLFPGPNQIGSVTVSNNVNTTVTNLISLVSGTEVRSLATLLNQPALVAGTAQIGSVTVSNVVNSIVTIAPRTDYIGLVSVSGNVAVSNFVSPNVGNVTLNPGPNFVGLVTTFQGRSSTTVFTTTISASGYSTVFVPPNGQRWYAHSVMVNAMGVTNGFIGSASLPVITFPGLATYGGFVFPSEVPGTPAVNVNESFTVRQFSLTTIAVSATVHFE